MARQDGTDVFDVAVVGGGFVGPLLALALSRSLGGELRVALVERPRGERSDAADVRCSALSVASRRMLEALGVWAHVAHEAQPVERIELTDTPLDAGIRPVLMTYETVLPDAEAATHIVPNDLLDTAIRRQIENAAGVECMFTAGGAVPQRATAGRALDLGERGTIVASLVAAAEGRHSPIREAAGIGCVGWSYGQTGIVTRVRHGEPHRATAMQHFLPAGPFAILPLTGQRSCITWSERDDEAARVLALYDARFLDEVDRRFGGRLGSLELDGGRQSWPLEMHLARSYIAPRLALVGDAAHGVHPIAGQGLNLGMRDVAALTECIASAVRLGLDAGDVTALERYQRWRRFDSMVSAATFDALNRLFSNDVSLLRSAREVGLTLLDRVPAAKRLLVAEAAGTTGEIPPLLRGELS